MQKPGVDQNHEHFFDLDELASKFPDAAEDMLMDIRMVNQANASCRLVRMYRRLPLHLHQTSDENVYVFSGRARFQLGEEKRIIGKGAFVQFPKDTPHAVLEILEGPLVTLTVDTPCRPENDVMFLDAADS